MYLTKYNTGEIIAYDMNSDFSEVGRIETAAVGLTGIKVGPDGSVWYTNRILNQLNKIQVGETTSTEDILLSENTKVWPNPVSDLLYAQFKNGLAGQNKFISLHTVTGQMVYRDYTNQNALTIDVSAFDSGMYLLHIKTDDAHTVRNVDISR